MTNDMTRYTHERDLQKHANYLWCVRDNEARPGEWGWVAGFNTEEEAKAYAGIRNAGMKLVYQVEECKHPMSSRVFAWMHNADGTKQQPARVSCGTCNQKMPDDWSGLA